MKRLRKEGTVEANRQSIQGTESPGEGALHCPILGPGGSCGEGCPQLGLILHPSGSPCFGYFGLYCTTHSAYSLVIDVRVT